MRRLLNAPSLKRVLFFILADTAVIWLSLYLSFLSQSNFNFEVGYSQHVNQVFLYFAVIKLLSLGAFRIYKLTWRFVGIADMAHVFVTMLVAEMGLLVLSLPSSFLPALPMLGIPKRVFFTDGILCLGLVLTLRISKRLYLEVIRKGRPMHRGENTLIVGAGNVGEMVLRDIIRNGFKERAYRVD